MNLKTGIAASIGAALCFTIMDAFVKSLGHIGTGELTFFRGLIGLAFLPVLAHFSRTPVFPEKPASASAQRTLWRIRNYICISIHPRTDSGRCIYPHTALCLFYVHSFPLIFKRAVAFSCPSRSHHDYSRYFSCPADLELQRF